VLLAPSDRAASVKETATRGPSIAEIEIERRTEDSVVDVAPETAFRPTPVVEKKPASP
jgi:hypothetical protein